MLAANIHEEIQKASFFGSNIAFRSHETLNQSLSKLKQKDINYFTYEYFCPNGHFRLTTHPHWIEHYYKERLFLSATFEKIYMLNGEGVIYWEDMDRWPLYQQANGFDIDKGFTLYRRMIDGVHLFHYGRSAKASNSRANDEEDLSTYNMHASEFIYSKSSLLEAGKKQLISNIENEIISLSPREILLFSANQTLNERVVFQNERVELNPLEAKTALMLMNGMYIKQVSNILKLSERMTKNYIKRLKDKFDCENLVQLGERLSSIRIDDKYVRQ